MKEIGYKDLQIIAPPTPKKKLSATSKKPWKKNVKDVEENEECGSKN